MADYSSTYSTRVGLTLRTIEILRPDAAGDLTDIYLQFPITTYHWQKVDDVTPDDLGSYVMETTQHTTYTQDLYNLPAHSGSGEIGYINVVVRCCANSNDIDQPSVKAICKTGGTIYEGPEEWVVPGPLMGDVFLNYNKVWYTNPQTGVAWTWADIDALQIGVALRMHHSSTGNTATLCTQVFVEVKTVPSHLRSVTKTLGSAIGLARRVNWSPRFEGFSPKFGLGVRQQSYKPHGFFPVLSFSGSGLEDEELLYRFTLTDSIGARTRVLDADIANPAHSREQHYPLYHDLSLRDTASGLVLWYGQTIIADPTSANLHITGKDGLSELEDRKVDALTGGPFTRRSAMISALITQNSYSGNLDVNGIEASAITGSFNRSFAAGQEGPTVLSEIDRMAAEDPWDATPTGYGYDFYIGWVSDTIPQRFYYFKRGTKPSTNPAVDGLTLKLGGVFGDHERPILPGYYFTKEGTGIATRVRVRYLVPVDATDETKGKSWAYVEAGNATLETTMKRRKLLVVDRPEIDNATEATALANAILNRVARQNIYRGHFSFLGFPVIKVSGTWSVVRAGHLVYLTGLTQVPDTSLNNAAMLLTSVKYSWPENVTEVEVLSDPAYGSEYSTYDAQQYLTAQADKAADVPRMTRALPYGIPFDSDVLKPALLPISLDIDFTAADNDDVSWGEGTITFANGDTQAVAPGSLNLANANPYYLYALIDNTALQNTQTFGDAVGDDRILIAFLKKAPQTNQKALIIPAKGGKSPTFNQDVISASCITATEIYVSQLSAISADLGLVTAGEARIGTGTLGVDFTGWRLWVQSSVGRFGGYASNVLQFYSDTDGKLYAGAGAVKLDASGIHLKGESILDIQDDAGTTVGGLGGNTVAGQPTTILISLGDLILGGFGAIKLMGSSISVASAAGNTKIGGVADPTANQEAATKKYVDDQVAGGTLGMGWTDVTATKDLVTEYQNGANIRIVQASLQQEIGATTIATSDITRIGPTTPLGAGDAVHWITLSNPTASAFDCKYSITFIVPPNYYYRLQGWAATTVLKWIESDITLS